MPRTSASWENGDCRTAILRIAVGPLLTDPGLSVAGVVLWAFLSMPAHWRYSLDLGKTRIGPGECYTGLASSALPSLNLRHS